MKTRLIPIKIKCIDQLSIILIGTLFCWAKCALAQLRTAASITHGLETLSPLDDAHYFRALHKSLNDGIHGGLGSKDLKIVRIAVKDLKYKTANQKKKERLKKIQSEVFSFDNYRSFMKPIAFRKKIIVPKKGFDTSSSFSGFNSNIPGNLTPSQNESEVLKKFGDQAIQNWLKSAEVRNSPFGQAVTKVEHAVKVETSIHTASTQAGQPGIDHKFTFQYLALQSQAKMDYRGWTKATVSHSSQANETAMEISEKVFSNKDLVLSHTIAPAENRSNLGMRWSW